MAELDHLVVAARTLDQGTAYVQARLGVAPTGGGKHAAMGTHNRVLGLGRDRYLEVIAIDPAGRRPDGPRWFDLDDPHLRARLVRRPLLAAWVARTDDIETLVSQPHLPRMVVRSMARGSLRWRFAFTVDGKRPANGVLPHLIQWETQPHPAAAMAAADCVIEGLDGVCDDPAPVRQAIAAMGLADAITVRRATQHRLSGLSARIRTAAGVVLLD